MIVTRLVTRWARALTSIQSMQLTNNENHNDPWNYTALKFTSLTHLLTNILAYPSHLSAI